MALSEESLYRILTEADRIVFEAQALLARAQATGENEVIEAAHANLLMVMANRDRLNRVFSLKLATAS